MIEEITKCDFCGGVVHDDDTYHHGECITNLNYYLNFNRDWYENGKTFKFDICSACLLELRRRVWVDDKFSKLFK